MKNYILKFWMQFAMSPNPGPMKHQWNELNITLEIWYSLRKNIPSAPAMETLPVARKYQIKSSIISVPLFYTYQKGL